MRLQGKEGKEGKGRRENRIYYCSTLLCDLGWLRHCRWAEWTVNGWILRRAIQQGRQKKQWVSLMTSLGLWLVQIIVKIIQ